MTSHVMCVLNAYLYLKELFSILMKKYSSLGQLLLDYRKVYAVSQIDLAAQFGVDIRTIIRWEKNETLLKPDKEEEMVDITFIPTRLYET